MSRSCFEPPSNQIAAPWPSLGTSFWEGEPGCREDALCVRLDCASQAWSMSLAHSFFLPCSFGLAHSTVQRSYFFFFPSLQAAIILVSHQIPLLRLSRRWWCTVLLTGAEGAVWTKLFSGRNSQSSTSQASAHLCPRQKPHPLGPAQWQGVTRGLCHGQRRGPGACGSCGERQHKPQVILLELGAASKWNASLWEPLHTSFLCWLVELVQYLLSSRSALLGCLSNRSSLQR